MASVKSLTSTTIQQLFDQQKAFAPQLVQTTTKERIAKLQRIQDYITNEANLQRLVDALQRDFQKPAAETHASETGIVLQNIKHIKGRLRRWMRPKKVAAPLSMIGTSSYLHFEPKGTSLIMAPWNYPFNLAIVPLLYAIAAGNTAVVKPSEISAHTSAYIKEMIEELFEAREVAVVEGEVDVAQALLDLPFNHVFFTGSPQVGKIVMKAASQHLASVTLELGGKSPAIVDSSVAVETAAEKTIWGKCFNAGQTCIAPDYLLVHSSIADRFVTACTNTLQRFYQENDPNIESSPHYARIISDKHFQRIKHLLDEAVEQGAQVVVGGATNEETRYIEPTILTGVTGDMAIMQEEIFGPVLPLMTFQTAEDVIRIINERPKPLSLYINSKKRSFIKKIIHGTSAGGTVINDYLLGYANPDLPFGGINNSGIGKSMGYHGFREFSNERGVIQRRFGTLNFIFPPYTPRVTQVIQWLFKNL